MENFEAEARKYKSAKEFIKAQKPVYHGSPEKKLKIATEQPMFFSLSKNVAQHYAGNGDSFFDSFGDGSISKFFLDPSATSINIDAEQYMTYLYGSGWKKKWEKDEEMEELSTEETQAINKKLITRAKNKGVDIIIIKGNYEATPLRDLDEDQYLVINHDILKTKSQLVDIWNKANEI
jgi:hypothetical protein